MYNEIHAAQSQYFVIGFNLKIGRDDLEAIEMESGNDCSAAFIKVINEFLRRSDPKPTWIMLADALEAPSVGFGNLECNIRQRFC